MNTMPSENHFNLHVRTTSVNKIRYVANKCNLSCVEVFTRMIDYACAHVTLKPRLLFELTFYDDPEPIQYR
jgi:hypothetical protein